MIRNSNKRDQVISIFKQSLSCFSDMRIKDMQMIGTFLYVQWTGELRDELGEISSCFTFG